jgi:hypothetical protein
MSRGIWSSSVSVTRSTTVCGASSSAITCASDARHSDDADWLTRKPATPSKPDVCLSRSRDLVAAAASAARRLLERRFAQVDGTVAHQHHRA